MKNDKRFEELRRKAEQIIKKENSESKKLVNLEEISDLIEELHIYQIELELQNQELREKEKLLEEEKLKFKDLYINAPVAYYILDSTGLILDMNNKAKDILAIRVSSKSKYYFSNFLKKEYNELFFQHLNEIFKGNIQLQRTIEVSIINKDGETKYLKLHSNLFKNEYCRTLAEDITEQVLAQSKIKQLRNRLEIAIESLNMCWWEMELPSGNIRFSPNKAIMLGYNPRDFKHYEDFTKLIHPEDYNITYERMREHLQGKSEIYEIDYRIRNVNNDYIWYQDIGKIINKNDEKIELVGITLNVTQKKHFEREFIETTEKYEMLTDDLPALICELKNDYTFNFINKHFVDFFGLSNEVLRGKKIDILLPPEEYNQFYKTLQLINIDEPIKSVIIKFKKNTKLYWQEWYVRGIFNNKSELLKYQAFGIDITTKKNNEEQLLRFRMAIDNSVDQVFIIDVEKMKFIDVNESACMQLEYSRNELLSIGPAEIEKEIQKNELLEIYRNIINTESKTGKITTTHSTKFGKIIPVEIKLKAFKSDDLDLIVAIARDISEQIKFQNELLESSYFLNSLLEAIPIPVFYKNIEGRYTGCNIAFEKFINKQKSEIINKTVFELYPKELAEIYYQKDQELIREGNYQIYEAVIQSNEFERRNVVFHKALLYDTKGHKTGIIGGILDITERKKQEDIIKENELKLQNILDSFPDEIYLIDKNFNIVYMNKATKDRVGESVISKKCYSNIFSLNKKCNWCKIDDALFLDSPSSNFQIHFPNSGKYYMVYMNRVMNDMVLSVFHDITEIKEAEAKIADSEKMYRELFEANLDCIVIIELISAPRLPKILDVNSNATVLTGYSKNEILNLSVTEFETNLTIEEVFNRRREIELKGFIRFETKIKHKDGHLIDVEIISRIIDFKSKKAVMNIIRDITERKRVENELIKARQEAESSNRAKSEFLTNISHEIRTPMNSILGFSEVMLNTTTDPKQINYLKAILDSGKVLLSLINDILDLSKIEARRIELSNEPFDLRTVIIEVTQLFQQRLNEKGVKSIIEIDENFPLAIISDEIRIRQILLNLIGNAVKFTHSGFIKVEVGNLTIKDNKIDFEISVSDTGIGISEEEKEKLFEAFGLPSAEKTKKYGGTGLGLAITKKLVELLNGSITVESKVNVGSKFIVKLQNIEFKNETIRQNEVYYWDEEKIKFFGSKILVVDDVMNNRTLILSFLQNYNLNIYEAENGENAILLAKNIIPDIIFMDIRMPGMSGIEATKKIRSLPGLDSCKIIALTASTSRSASKKYNELFDSFLIKPVNKKALINEITKFIPFEIAKEEIDKSLKEELIDTLITEEQKNEFQQKFNKKIDELVNTMIIESIQNFTKEIYNFADDHNIYQLKKLINDLNSATENYNFKKIQKSLISIKNLFNL